MYFCTPKWQRITPIDWGQGVEDFKHLKKLLTKELVGVILKSKKVKVKN